MKKKILVIYPYYNQRKLVDKFTTLMVKKGWDVDAYCYPCMRVHHNSTLRWSFVVVLLLKIRHWLRDTKVGTLFSMVFRDFVAHSLMNAYDHIDFHCYSDSSDELMKWCVTHDKTFDIVPWGSDILRASDVRVEQMRWGFEHCRFVKSSQYENIQRLYGDTLIGKYEYICYGCADFEDVDKLSEEKAIACKNELYGDTGDKYIIVCGYNGSKAQNHLEMISSLNKLDPLIQECIHVVFQMSYGATTEYINEVRSKLKDSEFSYTILDRYLSEEEVATVRKTATIAVNIQDTDGFAASVRTHLYCNNVFIIGEWLQYKLLDKVGVYYLKSSKANLSTNIANVISNIETYKLNCKDNHSKMADLSSWASCINYWIQTYGK